MYENESSVVDPPSLIHPFSHPPEALLGLLDRVVAWEGWHLLLLLLAKLVPKLDRAVNVLMSKKRQLKTLPIAPAGTQCSIGRSSPPCRGCTAWGAAPPQTSFFGMCNNH